MNTGTVHKSALCTIFFAEIIGFVENGRRHNCTLDIGFAAEYSKDRTNVICYYKCNIWSKEK